MQASEAKPQNAHVYQKTSIMKTSMEAMIAFHEDPKALSILTPPPIFVQLREDKRVSFSEGDLLFTLWLGVFPIKWHARHEAGPTETSFADVMVDGPMAYWRHEHIFETVEAGVRLTDRVSLAHKAGLQGLLTRLMFDGIPLQFLFFYRHLRTKLAVETKA